MLEWNLIDNGGSGNRLDRQIRRRGICKERGGRARARIVNSFQFQGLIIRYTRAAEFDAESDQGTRKCYRRIRGEDRVVGSVFGSRSCARHEVQAFYIVRVYKDREISDFAVYGRVIVHISVRITLDIIRVRHGAICLFFFEGAIETREFGLKSLE